MYHLPVYESSRHATAKHIYLFLFSLRFPYQSYGEKKNEICSLPHLISFPQNAASYLAIMFLATAFILVFDVKTKKRDQLRHKSLSEMSETVHWRLTLTWRLIFMITLEIYTWWRTSLWFARRSYTIPIYKVCFKFDIVNSSLFFVVERFVRGAVV